jgi:hypothetical protein
MHHRININVIIASFLRLAITLGNAKIHAILEANVYLFN